MQDKELNIEDLISLITNFITKNFKFIIVFFFLGLIIGFYKFKKADNQYITNVYALSDVIPLELIKNEVRSIEQLLEESNVTGLKTEFNIEDSVLSKFEDIRYVNVSVDQKMFMLEFSCYSNPKYNQIVIDKLKETLDNNSFIKAYLQESKNEIENNILISELELLNLSEIQNSLLNSNKKATNFSIISNPSIISSQILALKKEVLLNETKLEKIKVYTTIDQVTIVKKPSLKLFLFKWLVVVLFLGLVFIIIWNLFFKK